MGPTITFQPAQPGTGMDYDPRRTLPYPFHVDAETGDCIRGRGTPSLTGEPRPWRLIGFQDDAAVQEVSVVLFEAVLDPQRAVGKFPVFLDGSGTFFNLTEPITGVTFHGPRAEAAS